MYVKKKKGTVYYLMFIASYYRHKMIPHLSKIILIHRKSHNNHLYNICQMNRCTLNQESKIKSNPWHKFKKKSSIWDWSVKIFWSSKKLFLYFNQITEFQQNLPLKYFFPVITNFQVDKFSISNMIWKAKALSSYYKCRYHSLK